VGWRDRDWAKFTDDEWREIYGATPRKRSGVSTRATGGAAPPGCQEVLDDRDARSGSPRVRVPWIGLAVVATALAAAAVNARDRPEPRAASPSRPLYIYGVAADGASGHPDAVCTEMIASDDGEWRCVVWSMNLDRVPVLRPRQYDGPCSHAIVDQVRGAWVCRRAAGTTAP
jgi:hypothetical protein